LFGIVNGLVSSRLLGETSLNANPLPA